jgi:hypothetical protein
MSLVDTPLLGQGSEGGTLVNPSLEIVPEAASVVYVGKQINCVRRLSVKWAKILYSFAKWPVPYLFSVKCG